MNRLLSRASKSLLVFAVGLDALFVLSQRWLSKHMGTLQHRSKGILALLESLFQQQQQSGQGQYSRETQDQGDSRNLKESRKKHKD